MKEIKIEWMHYDKEGETCTRCNNTGDNVKAALKTISKDNKFKDIQISYHETKLDADKMPDSNTVLINGQKLEDILNATASENYCHSCSCLAGAGSNCRTIIKDGKNYEAIPEEMVLEAITTIAERLT
jgi:hypothetical protein